MADTATVTITLKEYDHLRNVEKDMNALIKGAISLKNDPCIDGNAFHVISTKELKTRITEDLKKKNRELNRINQQLQEQNTELIKTEYIWSHRTSELKKKFAELKENSIDPINNTLKQLMTIANNVKNQNLKSKTRKARK